VETKKELKTCYICTPYTHPEESVREERWEQSMEACARLAHKFVVYSPIAMWHSIALTYSLPTTWEFWWEQNKGIIDVVHCVVVVMFPGWTESKGVQAKIDYCKKVNKELIYIDPKEWQDEE
jgi:hypothetical protein